MHKKSHVSSSQFLDVQQAAEFLGVNPATIRRWAQANTLNGVKVGVRGDWRFTETDLQHMLKQNDLTQTAAASPETVFTSAEPTPQSLITPQVHWHQMEHSDHFVQFYEDDNFLVQSVGGFLRTGLTTSEVCIVIATQDHREQLERYLERTGLDLVEAQLRGQYLALDAAETLNKFMVNGMPDPELFIGTVGRLIAQAEQDGHTIRAFGEMVALLWQANNQAAAIRLEELWNDLGKVHEFQLFCAYPLHGFEKGSDGKPFSEIGLRHTRVIPAESYAELATTEERLRAISLLQQKAISLETEIAERAAAEDARHLSESRYRRLFEAARDGLLLIDPITEQVVDANPFMEELLGKSRSRLVGKKVARLGLLKDKATRRQVFTALQETGEARFEETLTTTSGTKIVEVVANRYDEHDATIIQCNVRDITERKKLERQKDDFIGIASHELKTPVTSIKAYAQILQQRFHKADDANSAQLVGKMEHQVNRLNALISDLLDVTKMEAGRLHFNQNVFDLNQLVTEVVEQMQLTTNTHTIEVKLDPVCCVFGDRDRISQVLTNLLTNAIKYSPRAKKVVVSTAVVAGKVSVCVQDFGVGIAEADQAKVFERFYRAEGTNGETYPGIGLGLYISSQIIRRHGGEIWVESQPGQGSKFNFALAVEA